MSFADHRADRSWLAAIMAASASLVVYLATASHSVGWHDSAELALVAWSLGASHAPGSPLHSLLGHLATLAVSEPAIGTVYLSVITASISSGILAMFVYRIRANLAAAVLVGLVFAFSFQVWASAVVTEVYSLGMLFLAASMLFGWRWRRERKNAYFSAMLFCYALALGAYFANILLLPAFAYLIWMTSARRLQYLFVAGLVVVLACVMIGGANILLATNMAPSGEIYPDSLTSLFLYMSGSQHEPLQLEGASFLVSRAIEHTQIIFKSLFYIGVPLALIGLYYFDRVDRGYGQFLFGVFAIYTGYYTLFGPGDYFLMIIPAYFVLVFWIGCGIFCASDLIPGRWSAFSTWLLPGILVAGLLMIQFTGRLRMASDLSPEQFTEMSFAKLPPDSLAIAGWKEFAVLNYFQATREQRKDVRFVLPARTQRFYSYGRIADYMDLVNAEICSTPVYTLKETPELKAQYGLILAEHESPWIKLVPPDTCVSNVSERET